MAFKYLNRNKLGLIHNESAAWLCSNSYVIRSNRVFLLYYSTQYNRETLKLDNISINSSSVKFFV